MNFDEYKARKHQMNEDVLKMLADDTKEGTIYTLHMRDGEPKSNRGYGVFRHYSNLKVAMDTCVESENSRDNENYCTADYKWFEVRKYTMIDDEYVREMIVKISFEYRIIHYFAEEGILKFNRLIEHELEPPYEIGDIIKVKNMPMDEDYYGVYIYDENQKRNKHIVITFDEEPSFFKFNRFENTEKVTKSPNEKINEISKKIKEMNGDFATVLQDIGIKIEILPF